MTNTNYSPYLSLVLPVYNEEECIVSTIEEAHRVLCNLPYPFEILAVDDGSHDRTDSLLKNLLQKLDRLRVLTLNPHSGQSAALGCHFDRREKSLPAAGK